MPQCDTTGTVHPMRSRAFITCAPGSALATRMTESAPPPPPEMRHHVVVLRLLFFDATDLDRWIALPASDKSLLVRLAPGIVEKHQPGFLRAELLMREFQQPDVDQSVNRRHAEGIVGI